MGLKFNPLTSTFDLVGSGGGSAFFAGEVATYADLPLDGTAALNSRWLVRNSSGTWPFPNYRQGGIYIRTSIVGSSRDNDYTLADTKLPDVFADSAFLLYDNSDSTRNLQFDLGSITTGTTRTLTAPNASGRIQIEGQPIGNTTPAAGSFTTLAANNGTITASAPALTLSQTWNALAQAFHLCTIGITNSTPWTASAADSTLFRIQLSGTDVFRVGYTGAVTIPSNSLNAHTGLNTNGPLQLSSNVSLRAQTGQALDAWAGGALDVRLWSVGNPATSATNFERLFLRGQTGGAFLIGTEKGGTGAARALEFQTDGVTRMTIATNGEASFAAQATFGHNVFITAGGRVLTVTTITGTSTMTLNSGGVIRWGTTNAFPSLRHSGTTLRVRLADDTDFAPLSCGALTINGNLDASTRNIVTDTTTGTRIGTGTTQLLGFWNATPAAQPAAVADATDAASTQARLNDLLARLRTLGLIAT